MSNEKGNSYEAFLNYCKENLDVAKKVAALDFKDPKDLIDFAGTYGFEVTEADMAAYSEKLVEEKKELSDEELEKAAGGTTVFLAVAAITVGAGVAASLAAVAAGVFTAAVSVYVLVDSLDKK